MMVGHHIIKSSFAHGVDKSCERKEMEKQKTYPVITYTHCLLNRPVRIFEYKRLSFYNKRTVKILSKLLAMLHDYILCYEPDYGIQYGNGWNHEKN